MRRCRGSGLGVKGLVLEFQGLDLRVVQRNVEGVGFGASGL